MALTALAHLLLLAAALLVTPHLPTTKPVAALKVDRDLELQPLLPDVRNAQLIHEDLVSFEIAGEPLPLLDAQELLLDAAAGLPVEIADAARDYLAAPGPARHDGRERGELQGLGMEGRTSPGFAHRRAGGAGKGRHAEAVHRGLDWLCDHQNLDGFWSPGEFNQDSRRAGARHTWNLEFHRPGEAEGDRGFADARAGITGLAMLAFSACGYDHMTGPLRYRNAVRNGMRYLLSEQATTGAFSGNDDSFIYQQSICSQALCELYGLSGDPRLLMPARRAVYFLLSAQNPGAGWRYGVRNGDNDTSVTGWAVLALKTAKLADIPYEEKASREGALAWLDKVTIEGGDYGMKTGYSTPGGGPVVGLSRKFEPLPTMDSVNVMSRYFLADSRRGVQKQADNIVAELPSWQEAKINYYYWYYGTLALYQTGGSHWKRWEAVMFPVLLDNQRGSRPEDKGETAETLDEYGSWDAVGAWCPAGGRVYATAINCMTLSVYERFEREDNK